MKPYFLGNNTIFMSPLRVKTMYEYSWGCVCRISISMSVYLTVFGVTHYLLCAEVSYEKLRYVRADKFLEENSDDH